MDPRITALRTSDTLRWFKDVPLLVIGVALLLVAVSTIPSIYHPPITYGKKTTCLSMACAVTKRQCTDMQVPQTCWRTDTTYHVAGAPHKRFQTVTIEVNQQIAEETCGRILAKGFVPCYDVEDGSSIPHHNLIPGPEPILLSRDQTLGAMRKSLVTAILCGLGGLAMIAFGIF